MQLVVNLSRLTGVWCERAVSQVLPPATAEEIGSFRPSPLPHHLLSLPCCLRLLPLFGSSKFRRPDHLTADRLDQACDDFRTLTFAQRPAAEDFNTRQPIAHQNFHVFQHRFARVLHGTAA